MVDPRGWPQCQTGKWSWWKNKVAHNTDTVPVAMVMIEWSSSHSMEGDGARMWSIDRVHGGW